VMGGGSKPLISTGARAASELGRGAEAVVADWWKTAESFCRQLMR
jgi:hypothetical protein